MNILIYETPEGWEAGIRAHQWVMQANSLFMPTAHSCPGINRIH